MRILKLIGNIYLNQKTLIKNIFLKFACVFINAVIGWHFNILNVIDQIIFPSSALSETDQRLSVEHKAMYILQYKTIYNNASVVLNVSIYILACVAIYQPSQ